MQTSPTVGPPSALLRRLTVVQHILFAALVLIGAAQAWRSDAPRVAVALVTVCLLGVYAVGARRTVRHGSALTTPTEPPGRFASAESSPEPYRYAVAWLLGVAVLWAVAVVVSSAFVWVAFALWLLAGHLLPVRGALLFTVVTLLIVVVAPPLAGEPWRLAGVIGPSVGAVFALALSRGQVLLARDALERARLVDSLVAAQAESAALQAQLVDAQREAGALAERTRLSRDIHDTLAQGFSSILLLARGSRSVDGDKPLRDVLGRIEATAGDNLAESRRIVAALAPKSLTDNGLAAALERLAADLSADTDIMANVRVEAGVPELAVADQVVLLRVAQGALANVRTHSGATTVTLTLGGSATQARLDIVDDGRGFDAAAWAAAQTNPTGRDLSSGGYGLDVIRARLRERGGDVIVESELGDGTAISASLPIGPPNTGGAK